NLKDALESPLAISRVHALRIVAERSLQATSTSGSKPERSGLKSALRKPVLAALNDPDALVRRCAAEALGVWPAFDNVRPLLDALTKADRADTHLVYALRKALRDQLALDGVFARLLKENFSEQNTRAIADVAVAVPNAEAGAFLLRYVQQYSEQQE